MMEPFTGQLSTRWTRHDWLNDNPTDFDLSFPNLGVRHVTKKSVHNILIERLREYLKVEKMMGGEMGQDTDHIQLTSRF